MWIHWQHNNSIISIDMSLIFLIFFLLTFTDLILILKEMTSVLFKASELTHKVICCIFLLSEQEKILVKFLLRRSFKMKY